MRMMNRWISLLIVGWLIVTVGLLNAQSKVALPGQQAAFDLSVSKGSISGHIGISHLNVDAVMGRENTFLRLSLPGAFVAGETGMPGLPVFSRLVEADTANGYRLIITSLDSTVIDLEKTFSTGWIMPVQPSQRKDQPVQEDTAVHISPGYLASGRGAPPVVRILSEGRMRGVSIARVELAPFRYDPLQKQLTVYQTIAFSLVPERFSGTGSRLRSPHFRRTMSRVVMDDDPGELKRIVQDEPVTMVILSDTIFREALQPLIEWKRLKGFRIIEAYTADANVGNSAASIREYMSDLYHNPPAGMAPPSYLLIAGDVEHVPVSQTSGQVTDLYYTTFDGPGDYLPEMFHGRISVKNDSQLTHVIDKILMYEKYAFPDPSFLDRTILIAGYDVSWASVHGNGQINYAARYYFNESNGIEAKVYLHPEAASLDAEVRQEISLGAALVNYTGHGEYYGWRDPSFRMENIGEMENQYRFGLMIGNGCSTNQFNLTSRDCFAEAILKLENRGAIGYIGCTNDSYWDEDYYWAVGVGPFSSDPLYETTSYGYYDKLFHLGNEPLEDWSPSLGEMIFAGNMTVQQSTSARKKYYWEIYQLMGDPSLVPWFTSPDQEEVIHPATLPANATHLSVKASAYDYVAISSGGQLLQAAHADKFGQVYLQLPETGDSDSLVLVVTGDLRQPYIDTLVRGSTQNGYLELAGHRIANESVAGDEMISPGERFSLDLQLLNSGDSATQPGSLRLECADEFVVILEPETNIGAVQPGETITLEGAFRIAMNGAPIDGTSFTMAVSRTDVKDRVEMYIRELNHAPILTSSGVSWDDRPYGNGNGIPDPGEQLLFSWDIRNDGSYRSDSIIVQPTEGTVALFDSFQQVSFGFISPGSTKSFHIKATLKDGKNTNIKTRLPFFSNDLRYSASDTVTFAVGSHLEDFSSGDLSRFKWLNGSVEWVADSVNFSGGPYALRSGKISHSQSTSVKIQLNVLQPDTLSFRYKVSSEAGYDYLKFYIDDLMLKKWSGHTGWLQADFPIDTGQHTLEWRYDKDSNTTRGEDAAWIDDVLFPATAFSTKDIGILRPLHPMDSRSLGSEEYMRILVINTGKDTINGFTIGYSCGDGDWSEVAFDEVLLPAQQKALQLPTAIDLSGFGKYTFLAVVQLDGDEYPGNDTLYWQASHYMYPDIAVSRLGLDSTSASVNLQLEIENKGNTHSEMLYYHLYLDESVDRDSIDLMLAPGEAGQISVPLVDAGMQVEEGWHEYLFVADPDSVPDNNSIAGSFYWNVLSLDMDEPEIFRIYPNPATNEFTIRIPDAIRQSTTISFHDLQGRILYHGIITGNQATFRAGEIFDSEGIYLLRLRDSGGKILYSGKIRVARTRGS